MHTGSNPALTESKVIIAKESYVSIIFMIIFGPLFKILWNFTLTFNNANLAQRTLNITKCPDSFLKHNLEHGFCDKFDSITQVQIHYSLYSFWMRLKWLKITQFFLFVWKTSNDSYGRPNLRIDMNQVTYLKSLDFTWRKEQIYGILHKFLISIFLQSFILW